MPLLNDAVREKARKLLADLPGTARLVVFTQEMECAHCRENRQLAEEVAGLSGRLSLEVLNLLTDADRARELQVDKVPALVIAGERDYGIKFYGVPAGFEFTSLLAAIALVSRRDSGLKPETRARLATLRAAVDLQVFTTLTCPYCPAAVVTAHRFALESPMVTAAAVDSGEFPQLAGLYDVLAVPRTVVNRQRHIEGVASEDKLLEEVLAAGAAEPALAGERPQVLVDPAQDRTEAGDGDPPPAGTGNVL